jgi:hypothetical protein
MKSMQRFDLSLNDMIKLLTRKPLLKYSYRVVTLHTTACVVHQPLI